jgi:predicted ferric reductase
MHALILLPIYLGITLAPLVLAALQDLPRRPFQDELASGLAMTSFAILLVEFVLSGRFKAISARVGMDVTMRFHQLLARTALAFALVHPFLYGTPLLGTPLPWDVTGQHSLGLDRSSIVTGVIAWVALPGFVLLSIFRDQIPYRYEIWRAMHAVGAAVIAVMITHHAVGAGRYSNDPVLAGFWLLLLAAALGSLAWTYLVAPIGEAGRPYEVASVRNIALKTWEVAVRPRGGHELAFEAGQFVWLKLGRSPFSLGENPFSISSAPAERPEIRFVIKEAGDLTREIGAVKPGTVAYLGDAHGNLTLRGREGGGIALIAGGVGIAPLLGIARQHHAENDPRPLILLYGNRVTEQIVYDDELSRLAESENTQVVHVISEPEPGWEGLTGQVDKATIENVFGFDGASDWLYLVCGPPAMLNAVEDELLALGVPARQIVSEQFDYD